MEGPRRVTAVWSWDGGEWKEAHHHDSPLVSAPAEQALFTGAEWGRFLRGRFSRIWPLHAPDLVLVEQNQRCRFAGEIGQSLPTGQRWVHRILPSGFFCFV